MLTKNRIYPIILIVAMYLMWQFRNRDKEQLVHVQGNTMGTTYSIKYFAMEGMDFKNDIDSLLASLNASLSTYDPASEISILNRDQVLQFKLPYFLPVLEASKRIYDHTHGAFDPTVGPLVNAWGFGPEDSRSPDDDTIDSLLQYVGFEKVRFDNDGVSTNKGVVLDFSAIAKGYGVDVVAEYLEGRGVDNFFIEIGGEIRVKGTNEDKRWRVGIEDPTLTAMERGLKAVISLSEGALATSGNYRNFYEVDGIKYAHTINPKTGRQVEHTLLSVSVLAEDCMTADAYATAFMVMGYEAAVSLVESTDGMESFFIYSDSDGLKRYATPGIANQIEDIQ